MDGFRLLVALEKELGITEITANESKQPSPGEMDIVLGKNKTEKCFQKSL